MQKKASRKPRNPGLAQLPAVSALLESPELAPALQHCGASLVTRLLRERLEELRKRILDGRLEGDRLREQTETAAIVRSVSEAATETLQPRPRPVINATGVVVHRARDGEQLRW